MSKNLYTKKRSLGTDCAKVVYIDGTFEFVTAQQYFAREINRNETRILCPCCGVELTIWGGNNPHFGLKHHGTYHSENCAYQANNSNKSSHSSEKNKYTESLTKEQKISRFNYGYQRLMEKFKGKKDGIEDNDEHNKHKNNVKTRECQNGQHIPLRIWDEVSNNDTDKRINVVGPFKGVHIYNEYIAYINFADCEGKHLAVSINKPMVEKLGLKLDDLSVLNDYKKQQSNVVLGCIGIATPDKTPMTSKFDGVSRYMHPKDVQDIAINCTPLTDFLNC